MLLSPNDDEFSSKLIPPTFYVSFLFFHFSSKGSHSGNCTIFSQLLATFLLLAKSILLPKTY